MAALVLQMCHETAQERLEKIPHRTTCKRLIILLVYHAMDFVLRTATAILPLAAATHTRQHEYPLHERSCPQALSVKRSRLGGEISTYYSSW